MFKFAVPSRTLSRLQPIFASPSDTRAATLATQVLGPGEAWDPLKLKETVRLRGYSLQALSGTFTGDSTASEGTEESHMAGEVDFRDTSSGQTDIGGLESSFPAGTGKATQGGLSRSQRELSAINDSMGQGSFNKTTTAADRGKETHHIPSVPHVPPPMPSPIASHPGSGPF